MPVFLTIQPLSDRTFGKSTITPIEKPSLNSLLLWPNLRSGALLYLLLLCPFFMSCLLQEAPVTGTKNLCD